MNAMSEIQLTSVLTCPQCGHVQPPGRPWFRHLLYAPGLTTGYAPWPFPELTEAIENGDPALFQAGSRRVVAALGAAAERMERAASLAAMR